MKQDYPKQYILFFLFVTLALTLNAQMLDCDKIGLDDQLYNGKRYSYFPPKSVVGNQFLSSEVFTKGQVLLDGITYNNVLLNLDILNQQLLVSFKNLQGADVIISLSLAYVEGFYIDQKQFVVKRTEGDKINIYQVISDGNSKFYIQWYKYLDLRTAMNVVRYEFSKSNQKLYYQLGSEQLILLKNNASFFKLFPKKEAGQIKKYMRSNKFKISKMSFDQYLSLLNFIELLHNA